VPGRSMQDNIEQANAAFHDRAERNELYLFLLHDFQKAYDSLSRRYLFSLLARIGTPQWVILAISALFHDVQARPVLAGGHDTVIHMANGLKQGCPLSPLLFNLALDPLLSVLSRRARTDCWGYADDVALGFQGLADLPAALLPLDRFKAASGLSSSTTIRCSCARSPWTTNPCTTPCPRTGASSSPWPRRPTLALSLARR